MTTPLPRLMCAARRPAPGVQATRRLSQRPESPSEAEDGSVVPSRLGRVLRGFDRSLERILWRAELIAIAAVIALLNLPLLTGAFSPAFIFDPGAVAAGQWWRLFSHPFVHVSWYHLTLDVAAFFLAYVELREHPFRRRVMLFLVAGCGSLVAAILFDPAVQAVGLCGLSGIAHGLTAIVSLELLRRELDGWLRWGAGACFGIVVAKCVVEALTGHVVFESWHAGALGTPIAVCHAGGVLGGLLIWLYFELRRAPEFRLSSARPK